MSISAATIAASLKAAGVTCYRDEVGD